MLVSLVKRQSGLVQGLCKTCDVSPGRRFGRAQLGIRNMRSCEPLTQLADTACSRLFDTLSVDCRLLLVRLSTFLGRTQGCARLVELLRQVVNLELVRLGRRCCFLCRYCRGRIPSLP